jgi:hypothetical protein
MRKAASHLRPGAVLLFFIALFFCYISSVSATESLEVFKSHSLDRDTSDMLYGDIILNGNKADATVFNDSSVPVSGGLSSYLKVDDDVSNQTLYKSATYTVEPKSKVTISVDIPCWTQVDLFKGALITDMKKERYDTRLIAAAFNTNNCKNPLPTPEVCTPSPLPSPSLFVMPTPSPTPGVPGQGGPNPTPVVTPTPTSPPTVTTNPPSTNNNPPNTSTPSNPNPVPEVLGSTSPPRGGSLPSTGVSDYVVYFYAGMVLLLGISFRKLARYLEVR